MTRFRLLLLLGLLMSVAYAQRKHALNFTPCGPGLTCDQGPSLFQ
jgi:hypothetical protein